MMPMPPTSSDTLATLASSSVIVRFERSSVFDSCSSVSCSSPGTLPVIARATSLDTPLPSATRCLRADDEIVGICVADAVTLPQQRGHSARHVGGLSGRIAT